MECAICLAVLCGDDAITHTDREEGHTVRKLKAYVIPDCQKNASVNILKQIKVLDDCYFEIACSVKSLIQEITRLANESLQQLQKKRVTLLDHLSMTSKRISAQELSELEVISQKVLVKKPTASLGPFQEQLQEFFIATPFKQYRNLEELEEQKKFEERKKLEEV